MDKTINVADEIKKGSIKNNKNSKIRQHETPNDLPGIDNRESVQFRDTRTVNSGDTDKTVVNTNSIELEHKQRSEFYAKMAEEKASKNVVATVEQMRKCTMNPTQLCQRADCSNWLEISAHETHCLALLERKINTGIIKV